jgi:hypothetical protein
MPKAAKKGKKKKAKLSTAKLRKWYEEQLAEKDRIIEKLKRENSVLLATALKQRARTKEIFEKAEKAISKKK